MFKCSAEVYTILRSLHHSAGLGSTNKSAVLFLFPFYLTLALFLSHCPLFHLSFYLKLSGTSGRNYPCFPLLSGYHGSRDTHYLRTATRLRSWSGGVCYSCPLESLVVSLSSYLSYSLFCFLGLEEYCLNKIF